MKRKNKSIYIILILIVLLCVSIGYAVIKRTLNITGNSEIRENSWDIHFENVQIKDGSVTAVKAPTIDNDKLSIDFSFNLELPGDFYEFTVDVKNAGTIDAMIDSITKTPVLTTAQAKYLNYIIEYQNGEQITSKHLVKEGEFVRLKVKVEYRTDLTEKDLPTVAETLNLGFTVNYVQSDGTGVNVKDNGVFKITANGSLEDIGTIVTIGTEQFYTIGLDGDNVKLLSMYNLYVGGEYRDNSWNVYGSDVTGKQDFNMKGYVTTSLIFKGTSSFSNSSKTGKKFSSYNGSIVEEYVNNYKAILESDYGVNVVDARLITKEELTSENIGCDDSGCFNALSFIYSTSYWSSSAYDDNNIWCVCSDGRFVYYIYVHGSFGVRPVIVIPKSDIVVEKQMMEFTIDGVSYQAEEGMTWGDWIESEHSNGEFMAESYMVTSSKDSNRMIYFYPNARAIIGYVVSTDVIDPNIEYFCLT